MARIAYFIHSLKRLSWLVGVGIVVLFVVCFKWPTTKKPKGQGFMVNMIKGRPEGPDLVFIEGGSAVIRGFIKKLTHTGYNPIYKIHVPSFYMDQTPITNFQWRAYLKYLKENATEEAYQAALPDETVWKRDLAYNDPFVKYYLRAPGYGDYPVVGVSWVQAQEYCKWRTKIVNEFLAQKYREKYKKGQDEEVPIESGYVLPDFRLPSEAEWEYAAIAMVGTQSPDFLQSHQRIYPWDGLSLRGTSNKYKGQFLANFKRGKGNYKGVTGESDSNAPTSKVYAYPPNDFGLYCMAGNVNEWVEDTYRPFSAGDVEDFNPIRRDATGDPASDYDPKYSLVNDRAKVYKGGSWKDVSYWLTPGERRYLDQDASTATIGFRCAMVSIGGEY